MLPNQTSLRTAAFESKPSRKLSRWLAASVLASSLATASAIEVSSSTLSGGGGAATGGGFVLQDSFDATASAGIQTGNGVSARTGWLAGVNNAPLMGALRGVVAGRVDQAVTITFADLASRAKVSDPDGDPVVFQLKASVGSFEKAGSTVTETTLSAGESLRWIPPAKVTSIESILSAQVGDGLLGAVGQFLLGLSDSALLPPVITQQPVGGTFKLGSDVPLSVDLSGSGPFRFQWMLDGKPLDGAVDQALNLKSLTRAQAGVYSVVVENAAGKDTSKGAEIVIYIPPKFDPPTIQPPSGGTGGGSGGGFLLRFGGADGGPPGTSNGTGAPVYVVQWSTDLVRWNDLPPEAFVLKDGKYELLDRGDLSVFRFYRIIER